MSFDLFKVTRGQGQISDLGWTLVTSR
jgi:hypothetical protein